MSGQRWNLAPDFEDLLALVQELSQLSTHGDNLDKVDESRAVRISFPTVVDSL